MQSILQWLYTSTAGSLRDVVSALLHPCPGFCPFVPAGISGRSNTVEGSGRVLPPYPCPYPPPPAPFQQVRGPSHTIQRPSNGVQTMTSESKCCLGLPQISFETHVFFSKIFASALIPGPPHFPWSVFGTYTTQPGHLQHSVHALAPQRDAAQTSKFQMAMVGVLGCGRWLRRQSAE